MGWYGTETLGDRAILLGLSQVFEKAFGKCKIYLGSIYPFLSHRSYIEDKDFYKMIAPEIDIEIFDVKEQAELDGAIKKCVLVAMGGGPIMDLYDLGIIEYGFGFAKKNGKKTALLGCGVGPLFEAKFRKITAHIFKLSDAIILRDNISKESALQLLKEYKCDSIVNAKSINVLCDPAIIPIESFRKCVTPKNATLAVNLREFPVCYSKDGRTIDDEMFVGVLRCAAKVFDKVRLIPMHTFVIGGDDRHYLSKIRQRTEAGNVEVVHKPLSVYELFEEYYSAECCIGMRYHSVVFQTILNGKNGIFDYTEPNEGKISGFLTTLGIEDPYKTLYVNIQVSVPDAEGFISNIKKHKAIEFDEMIFENTSNGYSEALIGLMN